MKQTLILLLVFAAGLAGTDYSQKQLSTRRSTLQVDTGAALENAPPMVAITTVAFGGFRGLIADTLWLRASRLQQEGSYFEVAQLADWITKLEPRFSEVWGYHAWNMSYNISALFPDPTTRWRWVSNGINLIKDQGIVYNPNDPDLMSELGWFYYHKIGSDRDYHHRFYKYQLATDVMRVLETPVIHYQTLRADQLAMMAIENHLKLDVDRMEQIDSQLGPLDWRLPETHSIYWATRGLEVTAGQVNRRGDTMVYQNMYRQFFGGYFHLDPTGKHLFRTPRPDLWRKAAASYERAIETHDADSMRTAYLNFLHATAPVLYMVGQHGDLNNAYERAKALAPDVITAADPHAWLQTFHPLDAERIPPSETLAYIYASLVQADRHQDNGETDLAKKAKSYAVDLHTQYNINIAEAPAAQFSIPPIAVLEAVISRGAPDRNE